MVQSAPWERNSHGNGLHHGSLTPSPWEFDALHQPRRGECDDHAPRAIGLLDAVDRVEHWNNRPSMMGVSHSVWIVPDPRLVAAVYALLHYSDPHPCGDKDDDELVVRFTQRRFGDDFAQFLIVGDRQSKETEPGADD